MLCFCQCQAPPTPGRAAGGDMLRKIVPRVGAFAKTKGEVLCMSAVCLTVDPPQSDFGGLTVDL